MFPCWRHSDLATCASGIQHYVRLIKRHWNIVDGQNARNSTSERFSIEVANSRLLIVNIWQQLRLMDITFVRGNIFKHSHFLPLMIICYEIVMLYFHFHRHIWYLRWSCNTIIWNHHVHKNHISYLQWSAMGVNGAKHVMGNVHLLTWFFSNVKVPKVIFFGKKS